MTETIVAGVAYFEAGGFDGDSESSDLYRGEGVAAGFVAGAGGGVGAGAGAGAGDGGGVGGNPTTGGGKAALGAAPLSPQAATASEATDTNVIGSGLRPDG